MYICFDFQPLLFNRILDAFRKKRHYILVVQITMDVSLRNSLVSLNLMYKPAVGLFQFTKNIFSSKKKTRQNRCNNGGFQYW